VVVDLLGKERDMAEDIAVPMESMGVPDFQDCPVSTYSAEFCKDRNEPFVPDMFEAVAGKNVRNRIVIKRQLLEFDIANHVCAGGRHVVDSDEPFTFEATASNINFHYRFSLETMPRTHSYSLEGELSRASSGCQRRESYTTK
jgi:hypothetical protein